MASQIQNVELTRLSGVERDCVEAFSRTVVERCRGEVKSLSVHGLKSRPVRDAAILELLVLLKKPSLVMEALVEELALDQFIETGITLRITCFDQKQFKLFQKMKLPRVAELSQDAVALFAA